MRYLLSVVYASGWTHTQQLADDAEVLREMTERMTDAAENDNNVESWTVVPLVTITVPV